MVKRVLFPGRFQPFHKGHLHAVLSLLNEYDEIVIAVGSAQEGFTCQNPFTAGERLEMIRDALLCEGIDPKRFWLITVPDINKPLAWTAYLLGLSPKVEAVATGNAHVKAIYSWIGVRVVEVDLYKPELFNGSRIRTLIANNGNWEELVPEPVAKYLKSVGGVKRVEELCRGLH
ncbi:MAG: nicotinamide-nucleotide adenylyltransferase [Sulfolobales archaeon]|nr:nicotinamide-nucleotide adenylyltransferase [Sulfolobales archaeon]MCX8199677.1 nicotinamide-nucleotide adenylyltransferase [Sulfolobales archaeon]MDW8170631.1 nicotinamide-nucleotide adenylyltransferase [Desulfurococcaceae archaeon]